MNRDQMVHFGEIGDDSENAAARKNISASECEPFFPNKGKQWHGILIKPVLSIVDDDEEHTRLRPHQSLTENGDGAENDREQSQVTAM